MRAQEYVEFDGVGLARLIAGGQASTREVAEAAMTAHELTRERLGAVVETYPDALIRDEELPRGPLRGVPFLVKDIGPHFTGLLVEDGSRLCVGIRGESDSNYGRLIKESGVNLFGRSNTPEFSMALCADNRLHGTTSNPWKAGYSTSGSSGGAAAAVAAGVVPVAHASDMGGSTRGPAAWCGTVGLQPSRGRVSAGPDEAEHGDGMAQSFVVTRSVRDTALMLDQLGVPQPGDPFVIARPARSWASYTAPSSRRLRIAWSVDALMDAPVDPEVAAATERVAGVLEQMGHQVTRDAPVVDLPAIDEACLNIWYHRFHVYLDSLAEQTGRTVGPDTVEQATLAFYEFSKRQDSGRYYAAWDIMNSTRRRVGPFFDQYDVWLTPTCAQVAKPNGEFGMDVDIDVEEFLIREQAPCQFMILSNVMGQPAISLPLGMHSTDLPIGVQMAARHGEEHLLIEVASALEEALPWRDRRPAIHVTGSA